MIHHWRKMLTEENASWKAHTLGLKIYSLWKFYTDIDNDEK